VADHPLVRDGHESMIIVDICTPPTLIEGEWRHISFDLEGHCGASPRPSRAPVAASRRAASTVSIRPPTPEDVAPFIRLVRASRHFHRGWVTPPSEPPEYDAYLERNRGDDFEAFLLVRRKDGVLVGGVNLSQIFRGGFQNAYVGYWIGEPYARHGYMRDGLGLLLDHAFGPLRLHRIEANVQPDNLASKRLVERLGFRLEGFSPGYLKVGGRWRDHERWAILAEAWVR
jgi:[ribosomal protein S5]-alanine N-acetyltransferase